VTGGLSCNEAGKQFGVAVGTAIGWVRRQRETGSISPGKMDGHRSKAISGDKLSFKKSVVAGERDRPDVARR
jgi:transposase